MVGGAIMRIPLYRQIVQSKLVKDIQMQGNKLIIEYTNGDKIEIDLSSLTTGAPTGTTAGINTAQVNNLIDTKIRAIQPGITSQVDAKIAKLRQEAIDLYAKKIPRRKNFEILKREK